MMTGGLFELAEEIQAGFGYNLANLGGEQARVYPALDELKELNIRYRQPQAAVY
jgi:hypothetical protein